MKLLGQYWALIVLGLSMCLLSCADDKPVGIHNDNSCAELAELELPNVKIKKASFYPAGEFSLPQGKRYTVPEFCRVEAVAMPTSRSTINFEVWMPAKNWNGRYYQHGEGGWGGSINYQSLVDLLNSGTAVAATDDGHTRGGDDSHSRGIDNPFSWSREPQKVIDILTLSLKSTYEGATSIVKTFYSRTPDYRYFSGCSGGGRQALIAARNHPQDWDGILAGAPPVSDAIHLDSTFAAYGKLWKENVAGRISSKKLETIEKAALAACDSAAHVVDGIAADPRFCSFDPQILACEGAETDSCLTRPQQAMLKALYNGFPGAINGAGNSGLMPTSELAGGWDLWITGKNNEAPLVVSVGRRFFSNAIYDNPKWNVSDFNSDVDPAYARDKLFDGRKFSSLDPYDKTDLAGLQRHDTKLIIYSGWADAGILPDDIINYYNSVSRKSGGLDKTQHFFRLFMVPGMGHCFGGNGANSFGQPYAEAGLKDDAAHNIHRALEAWVEQDVAPDKIIATKYIDDKPESGVAFTRPVCAYPKVPVYNGIGNSKEESSYQCKNGDSSN